jgi:hypothetical protein
VRRIDDIAKDSGDLGAGIPDAEEGDSGSPGEGIGSCKGEVGGMDVDERTDDTGTRMDVEGRIQPGPHVTAVPSVDGTSHIQDTGYRPRIIFIGGNTTAQLRYTCRPSPFTHLSRLSKIRPVRTCAWPHP